MATIEKDLKEAKDSEIDLLDLLSHAWKGLSRATRVASIFLIRKSLWLAGFIVLGICVALYFYMTSRQYYTSTMMAQANVLTNSHAVDYVKQLGKIKDSLVLAQTLNIPVPAVKYISGCSAFFGIDTDGDGNVDYVDVNNAFQFDSKDISKRKVPKVFYVQLTVTEASAFPVISEGLITALKNNPQFTTQNELRVAQLKEKITEFETQYQLLDSLERFDYFESERLPRKNAGQVLVLNEKERHLYHEPLIKLRDSILLHKQELVLYNEPITVIRGFHAPSEVNDRDFPTPIADNLLMAYIRTWVLVCLCLGIVFLTLRHHWAKILKLIKEK